MQPPAAPTTRKIQFLSAHKTPTIRTANLSDLGKSLNMPNKPAIQPAPPPPKPIFPENRVIKEGTIPKE
jgi:hypothetical protein